MDSNTWFLVIFIWLFIINVLDTYTTWLGLFKLPEELKATEANPVFKDISKSFKKQTLKKWYFLFVASIVLLYYIVIVRKDIVQGLNVFLAVDIAFTIGVLNNLLVYLIRKAKKKKVITPIGLLEKGLLKIKFSKKLASSFSFIIIMGLVALVSVVIVAFIGLRKA